jgi:hypothetical protein
MTINRMMDGSRKPDDKAVAKWIGAKNFKYWRRIIEFIECNYPQIFPSGDWLPGGKKHGWSLRFKKSKSFCTLIPKENRLVVQIVLGGKERQETEKILSELSPDIQRIYKEATTYHDGKWLAITLDSDAMMRDVERLLIIKRKPKRT